MTEKQHCELYHKIKNKSYQTTWESESNYVLKDTVLMDDIETVLDEAKAEWQDLKTQWLKLHPNGEGDYHADELQTMKDNWFKKWFLTTPKK
jgi:hypothetical protein